MYCYILYNDTNRKTYNGFTTNLVRRIRQHNNEIKGGAKYTTRTASNDDIVWSYLCIVESNDFSLQRALSFEWHIKHPIGSRYRPKKYQGPHGRLMSLHAALQNDKFTGMSFKVHVDPFFYKETISLLYDLKDVEVVSM